MSTDKQLIEMADDIKELDKVRYSPEATYYLRRAAKLRSMGYAKIDGHIKLLSERDTDSVKQDGYNIQITIFDEELERKKQNEL